MYVDSDKRPDFLVRLAWPFLILGALLTPMLVLRIGFITFGDASFIVGSGLVILAAAKKKPGPQKAVQVAIALGLIATLLATSSAFDQTDSLLVGIRILYVWTIWQFGIRSAVRADRELILLAAAFLIGATISALAAIGQVTVGLNIPGSGILFGRVPGLNTHVNGQGGVLAVGAAFAFGLIVNRVRRAWNTCALILCFVGLVLAGSVTGMLGAIVGIISAILVRGVTIRVVATVVVAATGIWLLASNLQALIPGVSSPLDRLRDTTGGGRDVGTLAIRLYTDAYAWARIVDSPFVGAGLDDASGGTYDGVTQTHNMLLLVWFQGGLLMLIAYLCVLGTATKRMLIRHNRQSIAGGVILSGSAAAFACSMTGPVFFDRWFWLPFVLALALPMKAPHISQTSFTETTKHQPSRAERRRRSNPPSLPSA